MKSFAVTVIALLSVVAVAGAKDFAVDNAADIRAAMAAAGPGDTITIKAGDYDMGQAPVIGKSGTKDAPIIMQAAGNKGYAKLTTTAKTDVGFRVRGKFWVLRGLHIEGNMAISDLIQVEGNVGGGDVTFIDCKISKCKEFLIKASRTRESGADNIVLDHCEWFDCPETAIDLVSGDNWVLRGNYVHDWGKSGSTHYGIFLKGGGKNGIMEGNIVDGKAGKGSIGISFGGGLTGKQWLPLAADGKVGPEHTAGIARNNIVVNTGDCAFHSNNGSDCKFYNNLAYNCGAGFQMQASYPPDSTLINNVLSGNIKKPGKNENNLTKVDKAWFVAPDQGDFRLSDAGKAALAGKGNPLPDNPTDFFGSPRKAGAALDLGPVNADAKVSTKWVDARVTGTPTALPKATTPPASPPDSSHTTPPTTTTPPAATPPAPAENKKPEPSLPPL